MDHLRNAEVGMGKWEGVKVNAEVGMRKVEKSELEKRELESKSYGICVSDTVKLQRY